jgi:uncharacterized sulfatase
MVTRRSFTTAAASAASALVTRAADKPRPNILWLTCEDTGPQLGCYGDSYATTPNLDKLAAAGMLYRNAWSNAPVCAPARTTIISGMYPTSTGSEHMRSNVRLPANMKMYPQYLREAGYYATNNSKEDYNLEKPGEVWDESSNKAHWRNRRQGQPFFAIFNFLITHESQLRTRPHKWIHDPAKVRVPAYHPDTLDTRQDWAQYYDNISTMDQQCAQVLSQLESDGLAKDTIVFFYGDHGSGMPRSKRWPYNSGLHVPLIVHIPEKFRHLAPPEYKAGAQSDRLVSFVDLAPTLLSLIGMKPPAHLQGHAFLGEHIAPPQPYVYGFRGRMDERYDMVRSVRDQRYVYIRNYMPHYIYGQHIAYMFQTPTTRVWKQHYDEGKLKPPKTHFWERKPPEELYDLTQDRDEVNNLAGSPEHKQVLERMRKAQRELALKIRDVGFLPEDEIHTRSEGSTPYEMAHDSKRCPLEKIVDAAEQASMKKQASLEKLNDADSAVRYWTAQGILIRGAEAVGEAKPALRKALDDPAPAVRTVAAQALGQYGDAGDREKALAVLVEIANPQKNNYWASLRALTALNSLGEKAKPVLDQIKALPARGGGADQRTGEYFPGALKKTIADLQ